MFCHCEVIVELYIMMLTQPRSESICRTPAVILALGATNWHLMSIMLYVRFTYFTLFCKNCAINKKFSVPQILLFYFI